MNEHTRSPRRARGARRRASGARLWAGAAIAALVAAGPVPGPAHAVPLAGLPDFTQLVDQHSAAVVNISTTSTARAQFPGLENIPRDNPFYEFYRRFFERQPELEQDTQSLGSGFIVSDDGYIITNNHVVREAEKIVVRLRDRREFEATLVGADERADVALLKIEATDLPEVRLGLDYELKVGEWVLAIGSPFGFDYSATAGIVSAKKRSLPRENYVPFIQTDVAINPGNSGGPLFNLQGEVVGVNAQIFTRTGQYNGLSFAIPIDVAWDVAEQLRTKGRVSRGWLGVMIQDVTQELAESFGMARPRGALIAKVLEDSPAQRAGFQVGDIVLSFDDQSVTRSSDLPPIVGRTPVNSRTPVEILRDGEHQTIEVVIAELPEDDKESLLASAVHSAAAARLGLFVSDLDDQQRAELDVEAGGVLVTRVEEGRPGAEAGIRAGDVVLMINSKKVRDSEQFQSIVKDLEAGKAISVLVQRDQSPIFLALKTER